LISIASNLKPVLLYGGEEQKLCWSISLARYVKNFIIWTNKP